MKHWLKVILRIIARVLFRVEVRGVWPTVDSNRLLIIANHESFLDGLLLGLFLPVDAVFVVHTWVANYWLFRPILALVDYLAVDPTSPMAMKHVVRLLESGRPVVVFPEGRLTVTGSLMKVYDGPAFVAARTGATVIPVRLDGPARSYFSRLHGNYPRSWFPKLTLTILPPEQIEIPAGCNARVGRHKAGESLRAIMQHMLFASRRSCSLYESLLETIAIYGRKRRAMEDMRQIEYSYGEFLKATLALGRLASRLAGEGERIGLLLPNVMPTVALLLGCGVFRRVPAMLNYTAGQAGIAAACNVAQIKVVVTSKAFVEQAKLTETLLGLGGVRLVYLEELRAGLTLWDRVWLVGALCFPRALVPHVDADSAAVTLFTSGSEGAPKGVVLSHRNLLANIAQIRAVIDFSVDDKFLNALPIFHAFGLTGGTLLPLLTGTRLFLYPSPLHYRIIPEVVYDRSCSVLFGTSTFLANYAKYAHPYDFYRLRYVVAGAEKLALPVREQWFEKFGIRILEGYGATETAPVLAVNTPMAFRSGTVGQFLPGVQWRLLPVPGIEEGGMLHVRGPNIMTGYLRASAPGVLEATESELGAGWYATGDIVAVDDEGFVRILGRLKRFAKIAGEMVSLETAERLAHLADGEGLHAASSRPDAAKGEALVLFTTSASLTLEVLTAKARELGLPGLAVAKDIRRLVSLPLLGTGKIDYVSLQAMACAA